MAKKNSTSLISEGLWSELRKIKGVISAGPLPSGGAATSSMEMYMRYWDENGARLNTPDEQPGPFNGKCRVFKTGRGAYLLVIEVDPSKTHYPPVFYYCFYSRQKLTGGEPKFEPLADLCAAGKVVLKPQLNSDKLEIVQAQIEELLKKQYC